MKKVTLSAYIPADLFDWMESKSNGNNSNFIVNLIQKAKADDIDSLNNEIENMKVNLMVLEIKKDQLIENLKITAIEGNIMERSKANSQIELENQKKKERLNGLINIYDKIKNNEIFAEAENFVFNNGFLPGYMAKYIYKINKLGFKIDHSQFKDLICNKQQLEILLNERLNTERLIESEN